MFGSGHRWLAAIRYRRSRFSGAVNRKRFGSGERFVVPADLAQLTDADYLEFESARMRCGLGMIYGL